MYIDYISLKNVSNDGTLGYTFIIPLFYKLACKE